MGQNYQSGLIIHDPAMLCSLYHVTTFTPAGIAPNVIEQAMKLASFHRIVNVFSQSCERISSFFGSSESANHTLPATQSVPPGASTSARGWPAATVEGKLDSGELSCEQSSAEANNRTATARVPTLVPDQSVPHRAGLP